METIDSLWRYLVKSMMGEHIASAAVTARGLAGDRAYALVDKHSHRAAVVRAWDAALRIGAPDPVEGRGGEEMDARRVEESARRCCAGDRDLGDVGHLAAGRSGGEFEQQAGWRVADGRAAQERRARPILQAAQAADHGTRRCGCPAMAQIPRQRLPVPPQCNPAPGDSVVTEMNRRRRFDISWISWVVQL
jgi:hypothetical protein